MTVAVLYGCGPSETPQDLADVPEPECLSCGTELEEQPGLDVQDVQVVRAVPASLTFVGDFSEGMLPPKQVDIVNKTSREVWLRRSYVVNNPLSIFGEGAMGFFTVTDLSSTVLHPGDRATVWVSFSTSDETREALLVVETSHPDFGSLVVPLMGRYFGEPWLF